MTSPCPSLFSDRSQLLATLSRTKNVDLVVVGGGASGLGVALDATLRGLSVVLLESLDFAKGTSSRATKLVHGGVRYLAQGNIALVREALRERQILLHNAPHLARPLPFVMPSYKWWEKPFYGVGLKLYDALAGKAGLGPTEFLSAGKTALRLPGIKTEGLKGGVQYWDGQFDDARLALALVRTAAAQGALLINYCPVTELIHDRHRVVGVCCQDAETGIGYRIRARCVINATGVWVDELRRKDGMAIHRPTKAMVAPSQGVHLVVDREFMPSDHALLVPKTQDGRVLFATPWLGKLILGTTDTPRHDVPREPEAFAQEVAFILSEAGKVLVRAPGHSDVRSIWVGLRPLVKPVGDEAKANNTKKISREHTVLVSASGLVTVTGGKWTTYRAMAEDVLEKCGVAGLLPDLPASRTHDFPLVGSEPAGSGHATLTRPQGLDAYGSEGHCVESLPGGDHVLTDGLTEAMVRFGARYEYARCVEDILARRCRLLFLDARLAARMAPEVARIMCEETGIDPKVNEFLQLAEQYLSLPG